MRRPAQRGRLPDPPVRGERRARPTAVLDEAMDYLHEVFATHRKSSARRPDRRLRQVPAGGSATRAEYVGKFLDQLYGDDYTDALGEVARHASTQIEVDRTAREADRQDHRRVLGADHRGRRQLQHVPVPGARRRAGAGRADRHLDHVHDPPGQAEEHGPQGPERRRGDARRCGSVDKRAKIELEVPQEDRQADARRGDLQARVRPPARGARRHRRTSWPTSTSCSASAHPFYNSRAGGGEGHLEVAKNIYYSNKDLAHMVLSLKPFGCMPSTQSDGAQSAVVNHYKDMIYLPIETSGEGEINAHSRVQMALGEAKVKAKRGVRRRRCDADRPDARRDARLRRRAPGAASGPLLPRAARQGRRSARRRTSSCTSPS